MKKVRDLDAKKKYRNDLWQDRYGDVWFWSTYYADWCVLQAANECADSEIYLLHTGRKFKDGYFVDKSVDLGDGTPWPDAPFRRIRKGSRK